MLEHIHNFAPEFYGSVTVGERGQVSIPAKVRKDMGIEPSTKLLVFSGKEKNAVMFVKTDSLTDFREFKEQAKQLHQRLTLDSDLTLME